MNSAENVWEKDYYMYNGRGSVSNLTSQYGYNMVSYKYDEFGNQRESGWSNFSSFGYNGESYDYITGLQYLRSRYYDPATGRFLTQDTVQGDVMNPLTQNLYAYCGNNPLNLIDPSGHWFEKAKKFLTDSLEKFNDSPAMDVIDVIYAPKDNSYSQALNVMGYDASLKDVSNYRRGFTIGSMQRIVELPFDIVNIPYNTYKQNYVLPYISEGAMLKDLGVGIYTNAKKSFYNDVINGSAYQRGNISGRISTDLAIIILTSKAAKADCNASKLLKAQDRLEPAVKFQKPVNQGMEYASSAAQYQRLKQSLATEEIQSVIKTTEHGAERLMSRGFTPSEISSLKLSPSRIMEQADGASVYIKEIRMSKFNVIVESDNGVVTALKNIGKKSLDRLSKNYGWK